MPGQLQKARVALAPNAAHVWLCRDDEITEPRLLSRYRQCLNDEEWQRHENYHFSAHRHQYLVTRAMVRYVLSLYCPDATPAQWTFTRTRHGRPLISGPQCAPAIAFNVSHTQGLVCLLVSLHARCGIDAEGMSRKRDYMHIARRFFHREEYEQLLQLPAEQQTRRFYALWTLKEAYVKARGGGLSIPLDSFNFQFDESRRRIRLDPTSSDDAASSNFWQLMPDQGRQLSIAIHANEGEAAPSVLMARNIVPFAGSGTAFHPTLRYGFD